MPRCWTVLLVALATTGCGAKTALEIPPPPPCAAPPPPAPLDLCETWERGESVVLDLGSEVGFGAHRGGAAVAYRRVLDGANEVRALEIDSDGMPRGPALTVSSVRVNVSSLAIEPTAAGDCALHALAHEDTDAARASTLAIVDPDGYTRTVALDTDEVVWDLRSDGETLTWLAMRRGVVPDAFQLVRADRAGRVLERVPLRRTLGLLLGSSRRQLHEDGSFVLVGFKTDGIGIDQFDRAGARIATTQLSARALGHASSVLRDGALWVVWSERETPADPPDALHAVQVDAGGEIAARIELELGDTRPLHRFEVTWTGGSYLVPVADDTQWYVGVFAPDGARRALVPMSADARDAEVLRTDTGALVVAVEQDDPTTRPLVVATPLRCAR
ncbi:hypothetical protein [Sandaracinus amylolyticus]|uniref:hypothetical protein n=1 Tax=Sandaracinus amylolyticus TaxID=927083 RepID=UPI001F2C7370|nr:hypothetical protein [Sandaracinus amylolyticus]UJR86194.1 Hypothetical protein I5071_82760 [Sandaracinus amylolyticus]